MGRRYTRLAACVVFVFSLFALGGCGGGGAGNGGGDDSKSGGGLADVEPDVTVSPKQLYEEEQADPEAAAGKYAGKVLQLEGTAMHVGGSTGDTWLTLATVEDDQLGLKCELDHPEPWAKVVPEQEVTVKVRWPEESKLLYLTDGVIVETGDSPALTTSAAELAKEYTADKEAAVKKYEDKWVYLDGVVANREENEVGAVALYLEGDGTTRINASVAATDADEVAAVKEGDQIKLIGQVYGIQTEDNVTQLLFCRPISE